MANFEKLMYATPDTRIRKRFLVFDMDHTLNEKEKTPIKPEMATVLKKCLDHFEVGIISGQMLERFTIQIVNELEKAGVTERQLANLHLLVTQGAQYYRYIPELHDWKEIYSYPLSKEDVRMIKTTLEEAARKLGYWEEDKLLPGDEIIEERGPQVTFAAFGQIEGEAQDPNWDPDLKKREAIVAECVKQHPEFQYVIGGTTSIDVTTPGMNKSFGINQLLQRFNLQKSDILFFGDMTQPGGNDYPVVEMGIDTITVRSCEDTLYALYGILGCLNSMA